jgi:hypothetical protein
MRRLFSFDGPDRAWYSHRWLALTVGLVILLGLAFVYSRTVFWVLAAALVGFGLLAIRDRIRIRRLIAERAGEGLGTFVRDEAIRSADPRILRAVFEGLQDAMVTPGETFPLRPSDELLGSPLYLDDGDLGFELLPSIARKAGRRLSPPHDSSFGEIRTVGDLVAFLEQCPKTDAPGGAF